MLRKTLDRVQHWELLLLLLFYPTKAPPVAMNMMGWVQTGKHGDQPSRDKDLSYVEWLTV